MNIVSAWDTVKKWMRDASKNIPPVQLPNYVEKLLSMYRFDLAEVEVGQQNPDWVIVWFDDGYDLIGMEYEWHPHAQVYSLDGTWLNEPKSSIVPGVHNASSAQPSKQATDDAWKRAMRGI